jgi:hypothetical protein
MKTWTSALRDALVSGSSASIASTAVLAAAGQAETGHPFAPTNAISHWFWGQRATRRNRPSWRYTALGYVTHHAASVFWATLYEKLFGERRAHASAAAALAQAGAVAALACFVDYRLTPARLMPGYEQRVSRRSLAAVYVAFAAGLALGGALLVIAGDQRR